MPSGISTLEKDDDRLALVRQVLSADDRFNELVEELSGYEWDIDGEPVILERIYLIDLLSQFIAGEVSGDFVHEWAGFIELRDDIDVLEEDEDIVPEIVHELANPDTEGELSVDTARALLARLTL